MVKFFAPRITVAAPLVPEIVFIEALLLEIPEISKLPLTTRPLEDAKIPPSDKTKV